MASPRLFVAPLSRFGTSSTAFARPTVRPDSLSAALLPIQSIRCASQKSHKTENKAKGRTSFRQYDLKQAEQFPLVDAMQYVSLPCS